MSADIRRLDGTAIDAVKPVRNERIAAMLDDLVAKNDSGRLAAFVAVSMTPETTHEVSWAIPDHDYGYPWGLALRGALVTALYRLGASEIVIEPTAKPEEPDGA